MEEKKDSNQVPKKRNNNEEKEIIIAYVQMVIHTMKRQNIEFSPKNIRKETTMFYEKFGNDEIQRLANIIIKEKKVK